MKKLFILSLSLFSLWGCWGESDFSQDKMKLLVLSAAEGSRTANDSLKGLFPQRSNPGMPDGIEVDTLSISGRLFYGVTVQFKNHFNNRFALYDELLNCYLIDKSLNGTLELRVNNEHNFRYFSVEETFYSNDKTQLKRLSIFRGDTSGFGLAFRTYTSMKTADTVFTQYLYEITPEMIRTTISAPVFSGLNNFNDDYIYNENLKIYDVRKAIYFDEFVTEFVNSIKDTENIFIKPAAYINKKDIDAVFEFTSGHTPDYYLSLNEKWKELRNKPGDHLLKKKLTGSKFINEQLGSDIYVFKIPFYEEAEDYIDAVMDNKVSGKYQVRYSRDYIMGDYVKKYFEYSCSTKKFLLLLSASRNSFQEYRQEYFEIINTFYIDC
jgi:hypothetical protein